MTQCEYNFILFNFVFLIMISKIQGLDAKIQEANNKIVNDDRLCKFVEIVTNILFSKSAIIID